MIQVKIHIIVVVVVSRAQQTKDGGRFLRRQSHGDVDHRPRLPCRLRSRYGLGRQRCRQFVRHVGGRQGADALPGVLGCRHLRDAWRHLTGVSGVGHYTERPLRSFAVQRTAGVTPHGQFMCSVW